MAYVAGDALVTIRGTIGTGEEWANTWAVEGAASPQDVADAFNDYYDLLHSASPNFFGENVETVDMRYHDLFAATDIPVTWAPIVSPSGGPNLPAECALRISLKTFGKHGGPYLAPGRADQVDDDGQLLSTIQATVGSYTEALFAALDTAGGAIGLHSPTEAAVLTVTSAKVGRTFDVIRRRRGDMPESYVTIAVP